MEEERGKSYIEFSLHAMKRTVACGRGYNTIRKMYYSWEFVTSVEVNERPWRIMPCTAVMQHMHAQAFQPTLGGDILTVLVRCDFDEVRVNRYIYVDLLGLSSQTRM